jgi:hypothetical protein
MNASQSRRRFLGVLSAGAAAAVAPAALAATTPAPAALAATPAPAAETAPSGLPNAAATPSPDAGLLQLFGEYMAANAEYVRLYAIFDRGQKRHQAKYAVPDAMMVQPGDAEFDLPEVPEGCSWSGYSARIHRGELVHYEDGHPLPFEPPSEAARARAEEIVAAHDKWHAKYWCYPRELRSTERQANRASKLKDRLRDKIDRTRAHTVAGLAVKAQVAAIEGEDDTQFADTTLASILRDMKALKGRALS